MEVHQKIAKTLQTAWQNKDFELLRSCLADDSLRWLESSFEPEINDPEKVVARWQKDLYEQSDLAVSVKLLDFVDERGYFECRASWQTPSGNNKEIDGIFAVHLNDEGKIIYFNQWWTTK